MSADAWPAPPASFDFSPLGIRRPRGTLYTGTDLNLYQRLIQYFAVVLEKRGRYLDLINFHRGLYPEVISLAESEAVFLPEHGYASPDGSAELSDLVRHYELARVDRFRRAAGLRITSRPDASSWGVGIGSGTTGVMNCLIPAIREHWRGQNEPRRPEVVLTVPLYSVYDGIVTEHGLRPKYLQTSRERGFLPSPAEIRAALRERPMALVLTYPGNPAQVTYGAGRLEDLREIVAACQESRTFLIADNIYQDTIWRAGEINPELLGLAPSSEYLLKVSGPSKDRPGAAGWRIGYYVGDARLRETFFYFSSIQYNTPNSASRCLLALDLLFRFLDLEGRDLRLEDLDLLGEWIASWARPIDRRRLFDALSQRALQARYRARLGRVAGLQADANRRLVAACRASGAFSDLVNDGIGNVILLRAERELFGGSCHELFLHLLTEVGLGILPANAFGLPVQPGEAWFRITTIHDTAERILEDLEQLSEVLVGGRALHR